VDGVELYPGMCSGLETGVHIAGWSEAQTQFGERLSYLNCKITPLVASRFHELDHSDHEVVPVGARLKVHRIYIWRVPTRY
jgi:hypothetical protein